MDEAESGAYFVAEVVVNADQFFAPVGLLSRGCVKEARIGGVTRNTGRCARSSWFRNHGQQRLRRSLVGGKLRKHCEIGTHSRTVWSRAKIAEITAALGQRWDRQVKCLARDEILAPFFGPEKERLLLLFVVMPGNINRSADGVTVVVLFVFRHDTALEPCGRIERIVPDELVHVAVESVSAGFGLDFNCA